MVQDFYDSDPSRGFIGGYIIALKNAQEGPLAFYGRWGRDTGIFGEELYQFMERGFGYSATIEAYGEQLPNPNNQVRLDPVRKDIYGLAVPQVTNKLGENEKKMIGHMEKTLNSIFKAAGATQLKVESEPSVMGTHLMGTCPMGHDAKTSVTNTFGQTHDIKNLFIADGSLFPTSTPANPSLTIQALATRVAFHIIDRFKAKKV